MSQLGFTYFEQQVITLTSNKLESESRMLEPFHQMNSDESGSNRMFQVRMTQTVRIRVAVENLKQNKSSIYLQSNFVKTNSPLTINKCRISLGSIS